MDNTGLPRYTATVEVAAFRILKIEMDAGAGLHRLVGAGLSKLVPTKWIEAHHPQVGDYYVETPSGKPHCMSVHEFELSHVRRYDTAPA